MSESENVDESSISFQELFEFETRNLAGCDNDDNCCTFPKGYVYRQALYHCITCKEITGKQAGICYPCSVHCHAGHILEDLYTKRNFRCDCGNSNFPSNFRCALWEEKDDVNVKNQYNHNFSGLYCVCNTEYDERKDTEEMVQCVVCEDWFHLKHLSEQDSELETLQLDDYEDFICKLCVGSHRMLQIYNEAAVNGVLASCGVAANDQCHLVAVTKAVGELESRVPTLSCGAFWHGGWRQSLCRCASCLETTETSGLGFLLNATDTMDHYYGHSETAEVDHLEQELSSLPYSHAIQFAEGVAALKRHLTELFSSFEPNKVVTAAEITDFFDKVKRRRLERRD